MEENSPDILKCTDSLDWENQKYLFSIINDDSVAKFSSFQLKLLSDIKDNNDFQFNKTIDHQLIDKKPTIKSFDSFIFIFKNINQNDESFFIYPRLHFQANNLDYFIRVQRS